MAANATPEVTHDDDGDFIDSVQQTQISNNNSSNNYNKMMMMMTTMMLMSHSFNMDGLSCVVSVHCSTKLLYRSVSVSA